MSSKTENEMNNTEQVTAGKKVSRKHLLSLAVIAVLLGVFLFWGLHDGASKGEDNPKNTTEAAIEKVTPPTSLSIVCVGDVMVHRPQIASQYDSQSGTYDYNNNFRYIKRYIEEADLALCNVETTFAGGTPSGYPSFNAPDALAPALAATGFDIAITANNHMFDKGLSGLKRTLEILRAAGLETSGTNLPGENNYALVESKGIKIGIVSYTYETPSSGGRPTINSSPLSTESETYINSFSYEAIDNDLLNVAESIRKAKEEGAELIICYYHWGQEYERAPNQWQEYIAKKTADMGGDILFASHPHVLQKIDRVIGEESGKEIPVFYSMGNLLSNQRRETLDNHYTEQGMIARVDLTYDKKEKKITIASVKGMGTWMEKYYADGRDHYVIIPLETDYQQNETLAVSGHLGRAEQALSEITELIGADYIWN